MLAAPRGAAPPWDGPAAERRFLPRAFNPRSAWPSTLCALPAPILHTARHCVCARPTARAVGLARAPQCLWYCLRPGQEPEEHRPPQRSGYPLCMSWLRRGPGGCGESISPRESEGTAAGGDEDDDGEARSEGSGPQSLTRSPQPPAAASVLRTNSPSKEPAVPSKEPATLPPRYPNPQPKDEKKTRPESLVFLGTDADQLLTRLRYSFVRVSISILSPMAQNSGTFSS